MFGRTYLDWAAGASGNPSSPHAEGRAARAALEDARARIARLVEAKPDDVLFTSGATQANALAILGLGRARGKGAHALYLPSAHASIVENMKLLGEEGIEVEPLPLNGSRVDIGTLKTKIRPDTLFVAMDAVCGETGVVWNTREVRHTLDEARAPGGPRVYLHIDASQAPLTEKIARSHFGADLLTLDGSKVGAPRGTGCLVAHRTIPLAPLYGGGGQERALVPGSEAPELVQAFAYALEAAAYRRERFRARAEKRRADLLAALASVPQLYINEGSIQAPHILNLSLPGRDTDYLVMVLDRAGFAVSTKSACETDSLEGSRAVFAYFGDHERAKATLRISWGPGTGRFALRRFARALIRAIAFIDRASSG